MTCLNNMDGPKVILFVKNHFVERNGIAKVFHNLTECNTITRLQNEAVECNCVDKDRVVCTITGIQYISEGDEWSCATYHEGKPVYSNTARVERNEIPSKTIDEQSTSVIVTQKPDVTADDAKIKYPYTTNIEHIVTATDITHIFTSYATTKKPIAPLTTMFYVIGLVVLLFVIVIVASCIKDCQIQ
ncbi:hypothetical protein DPMN_145258 [Dreissena polymorpha]|uniref:Uncharacterized protein n=2 Tax=Dreissena polymorpha TaxID=45954 RepID=A0A9D4F4L4_DREPO|nr:hypothetical protein DPMN_145258 [Dreissena polymorpha]